MADKKISDLTLLTPVDDTDFIAVVDVSAGETKKATRADFKGDQGDPGAAATVDVGSTITGAAGSSASVVNSGTTSAAIFEFTIPRGETGATGPQGNTGAAGSDGADGRSFVWRDGFNIGTSYIVDDVVSYQGSSYICILASTGNLPTNGTYFQLMAQKGNDGAGAGDMLAATYDPQSKAEDIFAYSDEKMDDMNRLGFLNQTETTIAFDGVNTFTLQDAGSGWSYYRHGVKWHVSGNKTVVLPGSPVTTGKYFISIDANDGTLSQSTTPWTLDDDKVQVATIAFNNALTPKYQMADERHSVLIDKRIHKYHHETEGTKYISGGEPSGYTLATDTDVAKTFAIAATIIADEDLYQTLPTLSDPDGATNAYVLAYLSGGNWIWEDSIMPFKYSGAGYMQYDNGGTMTAGTNGDFLNTYVFYSNIQGAGRYLIFSGKSAFATAALAYAENFGSFSMVGMFTGEGVALYQLTWALSSGSTSKGKCTLNRVQRITSNILTSTAVSSATHNGLAGLQLAASGVTYGHIDDSTQTIAGNKTFSGSNAYGTPASIVLTNGSGTADSLTSGITKALKSATTSVDVSAATAPNSGQVLTATSSTTATWQTPSSGSTFWTAMPGTPTRASNTTFTVTGDVTSYVAKGMVIKWTESSTVRNAMVSIPSTYSNPNTTITIIGDTMASIDASSLKYAMIGTEAFEKKFAIAGTIGATGTDVANKVYATEPLRVLGADLQVGTAGTTNSTTIDINKNGTTMFTTKPTLATTVAASPTPFTADTATSLALNDYVTIDIDAVQTTAAIDLYAQLYVWPTRLNNLT